MRFYYASIFSQAAWVIYCVIAVPLAWALLRAVQGRLTLVVAGVSAVVIACLPWTEEWWIAYNFDRLCRKDAGVFVYRTVSVDGFYDDTSGWGPRQLVEGNYKYKFVESRDILKPRLLRVEGADEKARNAALAWYSGQEKKEGPYIVYPVSDKEQIVVSPDKASVWRFITIERPTARYQFKMIDYARQVSHRITRSEYVVLDTQTAEVLGRYVNYGRGPYWFFIHLDGGGMACRETGNKTSLIYRDVLLPTS